MDIGWTTGAKGLHLFETVIYIHVYDALHKVSHTANSNELGVVGEASIHLDSFS